MIKINKLLQVILTGVCCFSLVACGPSEEKVLQAQQKYVELTEKQNTHIIIRDNILFFIFIVNNLPYSNWSTT